MQIWLVMISMDYYGIFQTNTDYCRSQWPRGLRRESFEDHLLGLRVRIAPRYECRSRVSVVCCQIEVSESGWSLVQRSPTECGVSECNSKDSIMKRPRPTRSCCVMKKSIIYYYRLLPIYTNHYRPRYHSHYGYNVDGNKEDKKTRQTGKTDPVTSKQNTL
jgi:hypothetical protein